MPPEAAVPGGATSRGGVFGQNGPRMPMRTDCKHYESRTYPSGDTVRKCRLDLAPEAPWRCPEDCPSYVKRRADVGWDYGSLRPDRDVDGHEIVDDDAAALLDHAEDIVNAAGRELLDEMREPKRRRLFRRRKDKGSRKRRK